MKFVEIIAEIANAHQGNPEIALDLAFKALDAGADAVKFQIYFPHELLVKRHPRFEHFRKQAFSVKEWENILGAVKSRGGRIYCDVFGLDALAVASENGAYGYKIHSSDLCNWDLLRKICTLEAHRLILSTGGSTAREIAFAINAVKKKHRPLLMHGFQSYPTAVEDSTLSRLNWLTNEFGAYADVGYQDHVDGEDTFAFILPLMAVAMGAKIIEKHITLDRSAKGVDYYSSLELLEFKDFISKVRVAELALGEVPDRFTNAEKKYRQSIKKKIVIVNNLKKGHIISESDLTLKRVVDDEIESAELNQLVGRSLKRDLDEESLISRAEINTTCWALVVARYNSSRLPGKANIDVAGMPAIKHLFKRLQQSNVIDKIVFCTTTLDEDTPLAQLALDCNIDVYRGPVDDVLARMLGALDGKDVDVVIRVTGDDILVDPEYIDLGLAHHLKFNAEYSDLKSLPSGTEVEFFDARLLRQIYELARDSSGTEYLTYYVTNQQDQFRTNTVPVKDRHALPWRLTLDTPEDYEVINTLLVAMRESGRALTYRLDDIVDFFEKNPKLLEINANTNRRQATLKVETELEWKNCIEH
jgi:N,N'-diacetyllegionaminate synthase